MTGAIVVGALDAAADAVGSPTDEADDEDDADSHADSADRAEAAEPFPEEGPAQADRTRATRRGRQYAAALERLARHYVSGGRDARGGARPLVVVHVQVRDVHVNAAGTIELAVRGALPSISLPTLEALARDADLRAVLFDGARPLATSAKLRLKDPSDATRLAVAARDRGDRWPGSSDPAAWCDVDHLLARSDGGTHDPGNLALLSRANHVRKHRHGWTVQLDGDTGAVTITRRGKTFTSLPRGTPLERATAAAHRPPDRAGPPTRPGSGSPTPGSAAASSASTSSPQARLPF